MHESSAACRLPRRGLPLTAFEEHMLLDDRPSHPMLIVTRFDFADAPPPTNVEAAFHDTLQAEPLLTARIDRRRWDRPHWVEGDVPKLARTRAPTGDDGLIQWTPLLPRLDPLAGPVLHAEVVEHDAGWSILLAVHHAACDGIGILGFVERWLLAAEGKRGRWRRRPDDMHAALLARGRVAGSWRRFTGMLPKLAKGLEGVGEFMAHEVAALADAPAENATATALATRSWQPLILSETLDEPVVQGLESRAHEQSVSVNDLLTTALIAGIGDHVATAGPTGTGSAGGQSWIRIGVPLSLRSKDDHVLPAANRVSMVFLDRQPEDRHAREQLIGGIRDQMEIIRSHSLGHIFPLSLELARLLPGGLARVARRPKPQCTAVLSNVGRFFHRTPLADDSGVIRVGGGRLTGWWGVPPIRPGTALAVGTHETGGRRTLTFHVDRHQLSRATAARLLESTVEKLASLAAVGRRTTAREKAGLA